MGMYKHLRMLYQDKGQIAELLKERLIKWRKEGSTVRTERPTRLDRARSLGYKAKQGYFVVRQKVTRGGRMRPKITGGRSPRKTRRKLVLDMNYQQVAEQRANRKYPNAEVLNSYQVGKDGIYAWYEIIFLDRTHPNIMKDPKVNWISSERGRVHRGLTSAGRKSRGLRYKGKGSEKTRPSRHAAYVRKTQ